MHTYYFWGSYSFSWLEVIFYSLIAIWGVVNYIRFEKKRTIGGLLLASLLWPIDTTLKLLAYRF